MSTISQPSPSSNSNNSNGHNLTPVYISDTEVCWMPAWQVQLENNSNSDNATENKNYQAVVQVPVFATEQEIVSLSKPSDHQLEASRRVIDLRDYVNGVLPLQNVNHGGQLQEYPDMNDLPFLHEAAILYNLKLRHVRQRPYTRTGDIVIAVNPYQWIHGLYSPRTQQLYSQKLVWQQPAPAEIPASTDSRSSTALSSLTPHVYEVSALSYRGLAYEGYNQSILVSGESGAGKTETVKICLAHIASVQKGQSANTGSDVNEEFNIGVVQRVVESNPLLEAFGNAMTRRNDNSSRFGKYLQLQFYNRHVGFSAVHNYYPTCSLHGSRCQVYLLETTRVIQQAQNERNFHIFYQLLASSDETKKNVWSCLKGKTAIDFKYLSNDIENTQGSPTFIEGKSDSQHFQHTLHALATVGVQNTVLQDLLQAVCCVLQLGQLGVSSGPENADGSATSIITTPDELTDLAELMGVPETVLVTAITERTFTINSSAGEIHKLPLRAEAAQDACNALAKEIYLKTFLWLVQTINEATSAVQASESEGSFGTIGLLDIFGFEAFDVNRFEQLCINYANEKLQQKFTEDIFRSVQEEYKLEGIPLADIWYDDNADVLNLIEGANRGLLALLNEECLLPKGNEKAFVQKALQINASSPCLIIHRTDQTSFGIQHYAGCVMYTADNFIMRNNDTLPSDLLRCAEASSNPIISRPRGDETLINGRTDRPSTLAGATVWTKYKQQLHTLMSDLRKTRSRYIRCIKPNSVKKPILLNHRTVVEQLRCAGVISGIIISRSVFPNRLDNVIVLARYTSLYGKPSIKLVDHDENGMNGDNKASNEQICADKCKALLIPALKPLEIPHPKVSGRFIPAFVVGKTRTYFRAGALEWLEASRMQGLGLQATTIQKAARGFLVRHVFQEERQRVSRQEDEEERQRQENDKLHARLVSEKQALITKLHEEERELLAEVERVQSIITEEEQVTKAALDQMEQEKEELEDDVNEMEKRETEIRRSIVESTRLVSQQRKMLEEQQRVISLLQKENRKIRKEKEKIGDKLEDVSSNVEKLWESSTHIEHVMEEEAEKFNQMTHQSESTKAVLSKEKGMNKHLRSQVRQAQEVYMEEANCRLDLQKTLAKILLLVQNNSKSKNEEWVEEAIKLAYACQTDARAEMAPLEADDMNRSILYLSDSSLSYHDV